MFGGLIEHFQVQEQGPFDGVVGFSQGGVVASLLAHMSTPTADSSSNAIEVWPFKFAIFFASFPASATECKQIYSNGPCSLPSLHFWGSKGSWQGIHKINCFDQTPSCPTHYLKT